MLDLSPLQWLWAVLLIVATLTLGYVLLQRRNSRRALLRQVSLLAALSEAGRAIAESERDVPGLIEIIYREAGKIVDARTFQLGLFDDDSYYIALWTRNGERQPAQRFLLTPENPGLVGWLREHQQSLLIRDFLKEADSLPAKPRYVSESSPRSAVFVPLVVAEESIGAMAIQSWTPNAFSQDDLDLLNILANQAAASLRNAQAFQQLQRRTTDLELISDVSARITNLQPLGDLFRQVTEQVQATFGFYAVNFWSRDGDTIVLRASTAPGALDEPAVLKLGDGIVGNAALGEVLVANDARADERFIDLPSMPATASELAVPLIGEGEVLGVLDLQSDIPGRFTDDDIITMETLADQLAIAVLEARHWQAQRTRTEQLATLAEVSRTVTSTLLLEDLLDDVIDLLETQFGYQAVRIFLVQDQDIVFRVGIGGAAKRWSVEGLRYSRDGAGLIAWAVRNARAVLVPDVTRDDRYRPGEGLEATRSELVAPLIMNERVLGVLDIQSPQPNAFDESDLRTMQTLADTVAVAVRNAQLYTTERQRRLLADNLREIAVAITSTLDLDVLLDRILLAVDLLVPYTTALVLLIEGDALVVRAAQGESDPDTLLGRLFDYDLLQRFSSANNGVVEQHLPDDDPLVSLLGTHLAAGIPLGISDDVLGLLLVARSSKVGFTPDEHDVISTFAGQAGVAITNADLFDRQREEAWVSTALLQVAEAVAQAADNEAVLDTVTRLVPMLSGVGQTAVFVTDEGSGALRFVAAHGCAYLTLKHELGGALSIDRNAWPLLAELTGEAAWLPRELGDDLPEPLTPDFSDSTDAFVFPLQARGRLIGVLLAAQPPERDGAALTAHQLELLSGIANQTATALEATQLHMAQQEEAWVSTALLQVAEAVAASTSLHHALDSTMRLAVMLVGVRWAGVLRWDEQHRHMHWAMLMDARGRLQFTDNGNSAPLAPDVLGLDAECAVLTERDTVPVTLDEAARPYVDNASTALGLPLRMRGEVMGLLVADDQAVLSVRQMNILNGIAGQLALAIQNERLTADRLVRQQLERELKLAHEIQMSFLPRSVPDEPGWSVAAHYEPARQVGGDFYDFIALPNGAWGLVVADVADKGIPAALFMALTRTLLRAVAINRPDDPARTLTRLNELLINETRSDLFVTCFYAVFYPAEGRIVYANAGHNWPLLLGIDGQVKRLRGAQGMPLSIFDDIPVFEANYVMAPGESLIVYTDGVTDTHPGDWLRLNESGLVSILRGLSGRGARHIVDATVAAISRYRADAPNVDDLTLMVVSRDPSFTESSQTQ